MNPDSYLTQVRNQYEDYPYPPRHPENERKELLIPSSDNLDRLNYYCYRGKRDFLTTAFRVLVAGGGTGDSAIALAEQCRDNPHAEIIYLDISTASMEVAKARAAVRGLTNITWIHDSLLNIPRLQLGMFDYINCSGVLHHLASPDEGLQALRGALAPEGAMGLMVYGQYGRTGLYLIQELLRQIDEDENDPRVKLAHCKTVLAGLSPLHPAERPGFREFIKQQTDIDLYDLYLHSQDRAYTIPQLYEFVEGAGLHLVQLFASLERQGNLLYDPVSYISEPELLAKVKSFGLRKQQAIAELLHGGIAKHVFYATANTNTVAAEDDVDNVPFLALFHDESLYQKLPALVKSSTEQVQLISQAQKIGILFRKTPHCEAFFEHFDGKRTLREIFDRIIERSPRTTHAQLLEEFRIIFNAFKLHNWMLLRHHSVPAAKRLKDMQCKE